LNPLLLVLELQFIVYFSYAVFFFSCPSGFVCLVLTGSRRFRETWLSSFSRRIWLIQLGPRQSPYPLISSSISFSLNTRDVCFFVLPPLHFCSKNLVCNPFWLNRSLLCSFPSPPGSAVLFSSFVKMLSQDSFNLPRHPVFFSRLSRRGGLQRNLVFRAIFPQSPFGFCGRD